MLDTYRANVAAAIAAVAKLPEGGVLIHCMGGKDRTGLIAALLLRLAGVPVPDIADDYGLSAENIKPLWQQWVEDAGGETERELRRRFSASPAEAMVQVLEALERAHGSVEAYLRDAGVTQDELGSYVRACARRSRGRARAGSAGRSCAREATAVDGVGQELVRLPAPLDADHLVVDAVADRNRRKWR